MLCNLPQVRAVFLIGFAFIAATVVPAQQAGEARQPLPKPKLVLTVMVDQLRYDYLMRWKQHYRGGLRTLLEKGANFTDGHLEHYPSLTAIGHSALLTGAYPIQSGIVGNGWYDRESEKQIESITDFNAKNFGGEHDGPGASPRRLLVSTLGDQMKMAVTADPAPVVPVVVGVSLKDRGAILPAGHTADGAFWYDRQTGDFVSSSYYFDALPEWVQAHNARKLQDRYLGKDFACDDLPEPITRVPGTRGPMYYSSLWNTPYSSELIVEFAKSAVEHYRMGQRDIADMLALSFSGNDSLGHRDGPDARSIREMTLETDRILGEFFAWLDSKVGMDNVLVVLSADHGVGPIPEVNQERNMPGGRIARQKLLEPIQQALAAKFGAGKWVLGNSGSGAYLNHQLIQERNLDPVEVRRVGALAMEGQPGVARAYTREQLMLGQLPPDDVSRRAAKSYHPKRSGDIELVLENFWIGDGSRATHGTPYSYDTHIPIVFMGPGVRPGYYDRTTYMQDIAPTLANMLEVEAPSGSEGRILSEMYPR